MGLSFTDYVLEKRIEEAKRLLDHSTYSLADITGILNFSSKSYFINCFKKTVGQTPTEYRNKTLSFSI
jgi:AraC-like DNA-binding protein